MATTCSVNIGSSIYVCVKDENDDTIRDDIKGQRALFMGSHWASFVGEIRDIYVAVQRAITLMPINFKRHIGGNWHVMVTGVPSYCSFLTMVCS